MNRRTYLAAVGGGVVAASSGCVGLLDGEGTSRGEEPIAPSVGWLPHPRHLTYKAGRLEVTEIGPVALSRSKERWQNIKNLVNQRIIDGLPFSMADVSSLRVLWSNYLFTGIDGGRVNSHLREKERAGLVSTIGNFDLFSVDDTGRWVATGDNRVLSAVNENQAKTLLKVRAGEMDAYTDEDERFNELISATPEGDVLSLGTGSDQQPFEADGDLDDASTSTRFESESRVTATRTRVFSSPDAVNRELVEQYLTDRQAKVYSSETSVTGRRVQVIATLDADGFFNSN